jgi:hypothetical protein
MIIMNVHLRMPSLIRVFLTTLVIGAGGFGPGAAEGGWFSSDKKDEKPKVREALHRKLDTPQAARFLSLVKMRGNIVGELDVFRRVHAEKRQEIAGYDQRLMLDFRVDPEKHYRFDPASNALYRVEMQVVNGKTNAMQTFERTLTGDASRAFLKSSMGKSLANQQIQALVLLVREKEQEQALVNDALLKEFEIEPSSNYRYDDEKRIIIKVDADEKGGRLRTDQAEPHGKRTDSGLTSAPKTEAKPNASQPTSTRTGSVAR